MSVELHLLYESFRSTFVELRKTLQKQEEETKRRENTIEDLQQRTETLQGDLSKAEKDRKELTHKVGDAIPCIIAMQSFSFGFFKVKGCYKVSSESRCW